MEDSAGRWYRSFLDGDEEALTHIIRQFRDGLMLYLNGYVQDLAVAEELTEDTFLKLVLKKPRFSARSSFKTWLYTIGRNLALDHLRRSRRSHLSLEDCLELPDQAQGLEAAYIHQQDQLAVHQVMKGLKQEYRQVLWLIYFEGFSCGEAGRIMGKSQHSTEMLVSRARQALRAKLIEEGHHYEKL